jgi:hypothetical protein
MGERLEWSCMICRRTRPDRAISVTYRPIQGLEEMFPDSRINVRHCNDNSDCVKAAETYVLVGHD